MKRILIACEESQAICIEFRKLGFEAYSCDLLPCSGGHPEWHMQCDVTEVLKLQWDMIIAHPTCTYLTNSGVRWLYNTNGTKNANRWYELNKAVSFFKLFLDHPCKLKVIENPIPHKHAGLPKYTQIIQPYQFGHTTSKATCLWLFGVPLLKPTEIIEKELRTFEIHRCPPGPERAKIRSKTFTGIAKAMAEQWGIFILNN